MATKKRKGSAKRYLVFDKYPVVSVIRWMGKKGFTRPQAATALSAVGVKPSLGTIGVQLGHGRRGNGEPAKMEAAEQARLLKHKKEDKA